MLFNLDHVVPFEQLTDDEKRQLIKYRNKMLIRREARRKSFPKDPESYYDIRLQELNDAYPELAKLGIIHLKESS